MQMIADWKLEVMCKYIIEEIWKDRNEAIKQACEILKECYQVDIDKQAENIVFQKKIEKIKSKIDTLIDMRIEGDISSEEYRNRRKQLEEELEQYEIKLKEQISDEGTVLKDGLNWDRIHATLEKVIDISTPKVDNKLVEKFVSRIVPQGNNRFTWFINLSDVDTRNIDMVVEGRKNNATVYVEKETDESPEGDEPSIHSDVYKITSIRQLLTDKKYSLETTLHRLLSQKRMHNSLSHC